MPDHLLPEHPPEIGDLVQLRTRRWLVEEVHPSEVPGRSAVVRLACADDDAQGESLEVLWDYELDRRILREEGWGELARRGFDDPRHFAAFLHTLRWNCVTATDPKLFQAPFRAGIKLDAYQMEPLRKALSLPRVNLFIADDTGLGKTIEAGLIARELLLRKKVKTIVVAAPPAVLEQWQAELEERFGLLFEILDRAYWTRLRRERGYGVNPWRTHSRFLVSHRLLIDPTYADPLREWLGERLEGSLLILDEAHHAAPASSGSYGIESKFTRAIRDLCPRFEHRLFLSATPHNGHSNSFSTLLELLDPYRFTRGVPVDKKLRDEVMVRRIKEDLRSLQGGFPERVVVRECIDSLPANAPELQLSELLDQYRELREARHAGISKRAQAASALLVVGLQQRLLSSIEAFAQSLQVHRSSLERQRASSGAVEQAQASLAKEKAAEREREFLTAPDADDERSAWGEKEERDAEVLLFDHLSREADTALVEEARRTSLAQQEQALLDRMEHIAEQARHQPEAKFLRLLAWIREHLCPDLPEWDQAPKGTPHWRAGRVLVFTENREGTKRYLKRMLEDAIEGTDQAEARIAVIDGLTSSEKRKEIQRRFNADLEQDPLRILLATDAAREGLNFQAHCADLFHYDLPWNPGRIEQRNGRIDRKLQPADEVRCHYFVLPQRAEDRVLEVLVRKTETIKRELGSLSQVIDDTIEGKLRGGIRHRDAGALANAIEQADLDAQKKQTCADELESTRARREVLAAEIEECQRLLARSQSWVDFRPEGFRSALDAALALQKLPPLAPERDEAGRERWRFPSAEQLTAKERSWASTLDSLRPPRDPAQSVLEWRREAPLRPVIFEDPGALSDANVHLHLEQRMAQRLLARFRAQGFVHHDLSRACLAHSADAVPRVVLLGRLSLYGRGAERLHEEIVPITAAWSDASRRKQPLLAYAEKTEAKTVELLHRSLERASEQRLAPEVERRLLDSAARDIEELLPQLEPRVEERATAATLQLRLRGEREAEEFRATLLKQRKRVEAELRKFGENPDQLELPLDYSADEQRQLEADVRSWRRRLLVFDQDATAVPDRIRGFYEVVKRRVEPIGLVYLWPVSN